MKGVKKRKISYSKAQDRNTGDVLVDVVGLHLQFSQIFISLFCRRRVRKRTLKFVNEMRPEPLICFEMSWDHWGICAQVALHSYGQLVALLEDPVVDSGSLDV